MSKLSELTESLIVLVLLLVLTLLTDGNIGAMLFGYVILCVGIWMGAKAERPNIVSNFYHEAEPNEQSVPDQSPG
jgi:hypothetical protein